AGKLGGGRMRRLASLVGVIGLAIALTLIVQVALGASATDVGKTLTSVKFLSDTSVQTTSSTSFVNLPGAATSMTVPSNTKALIIVRFSAQSLCSGDAGTWCSVRVLVGGVEADPAKGLIFHFDAADPQAGFGFAAASHAIEREAGPLGPGTYPVTVQYAVQ